METVLSNEARASDWPEGEKASERTVRAWPVEMLPWELNEAAAPEPVKDQSRTVLSVEQEASSRERGDHVTCQARSEWPAVKSQWHEGQLHILQHVPGRLATSSILSTEGRDSPSTSILHGK